VQGDLPVFLKDFIVSEINSEVEHAKGCRRSSELMRVGSLHLWLSQNNLQEFLEA
jgi:hypothetical protein